MPFKPLSIPALALSLAACSSQTPPVESTSPPAPSTEATPCGAEKFESYVGKPASDDAIAAIRTAHGDKAMRVIKPGMAVTMDYREDRLNIDVDDTGKIKRLYCS